MKIIKKWWSEGDVIDIEEITRTLQKVAENQSGISEEIGALKEQTQKLVDAQLASEPKPAQLDEVLRKVAESHQMLVELAKNQDARIDRQDELHKGMDERLNALIDAQVAYDARAQRLEESIIRLVELATNQEERIDGHDAAHKETDEKLNALINAQVAYESRVQRLEESFVRLVELAGINRPTRQAETLIARVDSITENIDQSTTLPAENVKQTKTLVTASATGVAKRKANAAKKPHKPTKKGSAAL
ncbi:MAG: hypothetical protein L0220_24605 [Acidobacteria bacterium]|nr:hypothetical protein [Acidobacteriota bacterium]